MPLLLLRVWTQVMSETEGVVGWIQGLEMLGLVDASVVC